MPQNHQNHAASPTGRLTKSEPAIQRLQPWQPSEDARRVIDAFLATSRAHFA